ncbi:MAG: hypothetical protein Q9215_001913 [Flavoplaca cf. flavocitrina]
MPPSPAHPLCRGSHRHAGQTLDVELDEDEDDVVATELLVGELVVNEEEEEEEVEELDEVGEVVEAGIELMVTNAVDETEDEDGEDVDEEDVGEEDLNEEDVDDDDVDKLVSSLLSLVSQIAQRMCYELGEQEKMVLRRRIRQ